MAPWWLLIPAAAGVWAIAVRVGRPSLLSGAGFLLVLGTLAGFGAHFQLREPAAGVRPSLTARDEESLALSRRFESLLESGEEAVQATLSLLARDETPDLQTGLSRIRQEWAVTAVAVYDPDGRPLAWVGVHRGQVPQEIRRGRLPYAFGGGPIFRYLYFTAPWPEGGGTVMAASLLQANLPAGLEGGGFASRFRRTTGVPIQIHPPDRVVDGPALDLLWSGEPLLTVSVEDVDPGIRREGVVRFWARLLTLLALGAWGILAVGGRTFRGYGLGVGGVLLAFSLLVPAERLWPQGSPLTSPGQFLLPFPLECTLGQLLSVLLALGLLCGLHGKGGRRWPGPLGGALTVAVLFPLLGEVMSRGPSPGALASGTQVWLSYQGSLALLFTLVTCLALSSGEKTWESRQGGPGPWSLGAAVVLALLLSLVLGLLARERPGVPPWLLALWGLPTYLAAWGLGRLRGKRILATWVLAAALGSAAALPSAWGTQIRGHMEVGQRQLQELGAGADPFLEYRLLRMGQRADSLSRTLESPVELLFQVWQETARDGDPLPMWLTLWSRGGLPGEDLSMGVQGPRPAVADDYMEVVREEGEPVVRHLGLADAHYLLLVPLEGGEVFSAVVPPRGSLALSATLGPIFSAPGRRGTEGLSLIPGSEEELVGWEAEVRWERTEEGWRGLWPVSYLDGVFLGRFTVIVPGTLHMVARGTLTLLLNLLLVLGIWGLGRALSRGRDLEFRQSLTFFGSFRARVTLALFAFFLLSIAIFGTLAFRTLSGAAERTASALAERIVEDGANFYLEVQGSMPLLADEVGADLLEYRDGELRGGSGDELVQLGLYEGWVPEPVFRALDERREVRATVRSSLGQWDYVMAYRWLPDGDILSSPVPVEAGATALRRQEVADLLGFAIVLGAALSLGLALLVGRTLSRPIETLQVASERVGSGNLKVRLPENRKDEFGSVFDAFNRMVHRIRRARRDLVRTTRRTQAIVEEAATGVVALDGSGRVTLVNPRAEDLLGETVALGDPLPGREGEALELVRWVDLYFRDGLREANTELQLGERRIRIRARRITGDGEPLGGAVLSLEDVTDELRTERILAWGEMAQQVAHEVKNPLTPIKLSVQHLQRAWEDRRGDFGEILGRNVEVILREMEHLAAIARSFSRFSVPGVAGEEPLEAVSISEVVEEVMNLYRGGKGALNFQARVPGDLPRVQARVSELREVLINLLENSRAAIPEAGTVTVEAEVGRRHVTLRVRDDGTGISPELLGRIFEPHFSTRSTGTGLGLAIVRRLVESWGGVVTAKSREGTGTTIRMDLPLWEEGGSRSEEEEES